MIGRKGIQLGEFEEVVLLATAILGQRAYGISIKHEIEKRLNRDPSIGALHSSLSRLEEKGYLSSCEGETTPERGGRRRRYYTVTKSGVAAMQKTREVREEMWKDIPLASLTLKRT